ncbi:MAG: T9SS type A sorting domain-containing protein [Flavobacteriales bacterium]|nr:T9SS type A sorting domain-containing protein [Flavobacteriales bacterium]
MKHLSAVLYLAMGLGTHYAVHAQTIPQHDHVVIVVMENHAYTNIEGSFFAPYVNSLLSDPHTANFTSSHGLAHPSQPNYIMLFSGADQGVTDDNLPSGLPFTTPNLGAELLDSNYTFIGYSEDLPAVGSDVETSGDYARKHNPWVNWQDSPGNGIPAALNQPLTSFPTDFNNLPTVSFVMPNLAHDMHNPVLLPNAISNGDTWLQDHLDAYIQWAKTHNSLFILTFDEDDLLHSNRIMTLFIGENVIGGDYDENITHYNILRTMQDVYGLSYCGNSANVTPITDVWAQTPTDVVQELNETDINLYPNPTVGTITLETTDGNGFCEIHNVAGQRLYSSAITSTRQTLDMSNWDSGIYFISITDGEKVIRKKVVKD